MIFGPFSELVVFFLGKFWWKRSIGKHNWPAFFWHIWFFPKKRTSSESVWSCLECLLNKESKKPTCQTWSPSLRAFGSDDRAGGGVHADQDHGGWSPCRADDLRSQLAVSPCAAAEHKFKLKMKQSWRLNSWTSSWLMLDSFDSQVWKQCSHWWHSNGLRWLTSAQSGSEKKKWPTGCHDIFSHICNMVYSFFRIFFLLAIDFRDVFFLVSLIWKIHRFSWDLCEQICRAKAKLNYEDFSQVQTSCLAPWGKEHRFMFNFFGL